MDASNWISLISVAVGAGAVIASLFIANNQARIQAEAAQSQFRASVLSANRQAWINSLRDQLSVFLAAVFAHSQELELCTLSKELFVSRIQEILTLSFKIELMLNAKEPDHQELVQLVKDAYINVLMASDPEVFVKARKYRDDILAKSQAILKREWERVKQGV